MSHLVKDYMEKDIATVDVGTSATEVSKMMMAKGVGYLVVVEKGRPAGIVTDRDLVLKVMAKERDPSKVRVSEVMSAPLITIDPDASVEEAIKTMIEHGVRRLPVTRDNIFYGMFTGQDIAKHFDEYEAKVAGDMIKHMSLFSRILARVAR